MTFLKWVGKFPTSVLDEIYLLTKRIPGEHKITLVSDDEIMLTSKNAVDMDVAIESDLYLSSLVR